MKTWTTSGNRVLRLQDHSLAIEEIVEAVQDIAAQSNLLGRERIN